MGSSVQRIKVASDFFERGRERVYIYEMLIPAFHEVKNNLEFNNLFSNRMALSFSRTHSRRFKIGDKLSFPSFGARNCYTV